MADKDVPQVGGFKRRMMQVLTGVMVPYHAPLPASSAAVSNVAASATNVTLKAANTARRGLWVYNDSDKSLYVKMGAAATFSSYSVKVLAGGYWEMPEPIYAGIVDAIWGPDPTGNARVTELS